jgi:hypothetical protein
MPIIKADKDGNLYAHVGEWIAIPENGITSFKEGDIVEGFHFGGTSRIGMGKLEGRGEYAEYWVTANVNYPTTPLTLSGSSL